MVCRKTLLFLIVLVYAIMLAMSVCASTSGQLGDADVSADNYNFYQERVKAQ